MTSNPQRVIVYHSKAEQMQDDYLWGEGLITPLGITDILLFLVVVGFVLVGFSKFRGRN